MILALPLIADSAGLVPLRQQQQGTSFTQSDPNVTGREPNFTPELIPFAVFHPHHPPPPPTHSCPNNLLLVTPPPPPPPPTHVLTIYSWLLLPLPPHHPLMP
jgi:hypothetical protein